MTSLTGFILFFLGLVPLIVSAIVVEKYYVSFWNAFWNIYGTIISLFGAIVSTENPDQYIPLAFLAVVLSLVLYFALFADDPNLRDIATSFVRMFGASIASIFFVTWVYFWVVTGSGMFGLIMGLLFASIIYFVGAERHRL